MRLLLLESEPSMPAFIKHVLSDIDLEYTSDLMEALRWYNERAPYDIVLAGLSSANGISLAMHIRRINPTQIVGLMTGLPVEEISKVHDLKIPVLYKPFSAHDLIAFVNRLRKTKDS